MRSHMYECNVCREKFSSESFDIVQSGETGLAEHEHIGSTVLSK